MWMEKLGNRIYTSLIHLAGGRGCGWASRISTFGLLSWVQSSCPPGYHKEDGLSRASMGLTLQGCADAAQDAALPSSKRSANGPTLSSAFQRRGASLVVQLVKNPPAMQETWVRSLGWEDPLEKGKATHSSILAWRIPWTVQSMVLQRVRHDWATFTFTFQRRDSHALLHSSAHVSSSIAQPICPPLFCAVAKDFPGSTSTWLWSDCPQPRGHCWSGSGCMSGTDVWWLSSTHSHHQVGVNFCHSCHALNSN